MLFKGGLCYVIFLLLLKAAQMMLAYVSAAGKLTLKMCWWGETGRKKADKKMSEDVTGNKQQLGWYKLCKLWSSFDSFDFQLVLKSHTLVIISLGANQVSRKCRKHSLGLASVVDFNATFLAHAALPCPAHKREQMQHICFCDLVIHTQPPPSCLEIPPQLSCTITLNNLSWRTLNRPFL